MFDDLNHFFSGIGEIATIENFERLIRDSCNTHRQQEQKEAFDSDPMAHLSLTGRRGTIYCWTIVIWLESVVKIGIFSTWTP